MKLIGSFLGILFLFFALNASADAVVRGQFTCSSIHQKSRTCYVGPMANIRFSHQVSESSCIMGRTMFIQRDQVSVTNGCRAVFVANMSSSFVNEGQRILALTGDMSFYMRFDTDGRHFIPYNRILNIRLVQQHSQAACINGRTYFVGGNQVLLRNGCRATFVIRGY